MKLFIAIIISTFLWADICVAKENKDPSKVCDIMEKSFLNPQNTPWEAYQEAMFYIFKKAAEMKKSHADISKFKQEFNAIPANNRVKEMYSLYTDIGNGNLTKDYKCDKKLANEIKNKIKSYYLPIETKKYDDCMEGLKDSSTVLMEFVWSPYVNIQKRPQKGYIYKNPAHMNINYLKVTQQVPGGVLVIGESPYGITDKTIYIKTNESYVDDDILDPDVDGYYVYIGTKQYLTVLGSQKTVHAFEKFDRNKCLDGLYFYHP